MWLAYFDCSTPFEKVSLENGIVMAVSNLGHSWHFPLTRPERLTVDTRGKCHEDCAEKTIYVAETALGRRTSFYGKQICNGSVKRNAGFRRFSISPFEGQVSALAILHLWLYWTHGDGRSHYDCEIPKVPRKDFTHNSRDLVKI